MFNPRIGLISAAIFSISPYAIFWVSYITPDNLLRAFTINVIPSFLFARTLVPAMIERGWGRIVNLSSIGVKFGGGSKTFCYSLSKHALEFFPSDHKNWASKNVLINTLRVGVTDTRAHTIDPEKDKKPTYWPLKSYKYIKDSNHDHSITYPSVLNSLLQTSIIEDNSKYFNLANNVLKY